MNRPGRNGAEAAQVGLGRLRRHEHTSQALIISPQLGPLSWLPCRRPGGAATRGENATADEWRTDPAACVRRTWQSRTRTRHSLLGAEPARQLPQDLLKHVAGMPRIFKGTAAARTLRTLRIKGSSSRWLQKRSIPPKRTVGGAGIDVVVARESPYSIYRHAGSGSEAVDPVWRKAPRDTERVFSAQRAGPLTRHRPFGAWA